MAFCQVSGPRGGGSWAGLSEREDSGEGHGWSDLSGFLPQSSGFTAERAALHLDVVRAGHLSALGNGRDAGEYLCYGEKGRQHDV